MLLIIKFCEGAFDSIRSRPPLFTKRVRQSLIFISALFLVTPKKEVQQNNKERKGKHRNFFSFFQATPDGKGLKYYGTLIISNVSADFILVVLSTSGDNDENE